MYKFTIIIPIYNGEKHIIRCINSILNQKYRNFEIILIDDGSTDNTYNIILEYSKKNYNIKVIKTQNKGVSNARNLGIEVATGDYITFIDSDDYIDMGLLEFANDKINKMNVDILKYNYYYQYKRIKIKHKFDINTEQIIRKNEYINWIWRNIISSCDFANVWNTFFKRDIIESIKFDTTIKYSEDRKFMYEALKESKSVYISDKAFYHYVFNEESAINNKELYKSIEKLQNVISTNYYLSNDIKEININNSLINSIKGDINEFVVSNISLKTFQDYINGINIIYNDKKTIKLTMDILEIYKTQEKYDELKRLYKKRHIKKAIKCVL